ncbi:TetR/AcrR family transcriptional regulator [Streptomyces sp. NBC_01275]|uniref:TetR/AcrR family transcriptional regulator n=1 Tax=Streptomyces sp. NBC_01275 TaxID=2903807 RepID=UPI00225A5CDD|nr:TetR/AcrR family transcriptional regulator [Streptomyces sp. NBC_01275]MCX4761529.1 TetR/AcrR family transcriptional regulator [Streptomyces sp. NBC_01275]
MVKQERAARTRETLMQAAAEFFDRDGYGTTTLSRISKAAGISMGALTFHFPTKDDLADAVQVRGGTITRDALDRVAVDPDRPLRVLVGVTLELARLLEKEAIVRAAARLTRERRSTSADWPATWLPTVERLLESATGHDLRQGIDPKAVQALVVHLLTGAEAQIRCATSGARDPSESAESQLSDIWHVVLRGVADGTRTQGRGEDELVS